MEKLLNIIPHQTTHCYSMSTQFETLYKDYNIWIDIETVGPENLIRTVIAMNESHTSAILATTEDLDCNYTWYQCRSNENTLEKFYKYYIERRRKPIYYEPLGLWTTDSDTITISFSNDNNGPILEFDSNKNNDGKGKLIQREPP